MNKQRTSGGLRWAAMVVLLSYACAPVEERRPSDDVADSSALSDVIGQAEASRTEADAELTSDADDRSDASDHDGDVERTSDAGNEGDAGSQDDAADAAAPAIDAAPVSSPSAADWIVGVYYRAASESLFAPSRRPARLEFFTLPDGRRTWTWIDDLISREGTWRSLDARSVELTDDRTGSTQRLDAASFAAGCQILRFDGVSLRRSSEVPGCPFAVEPLSPEECSMATRTIRWHRSTVGAGEFHSLLLLEGRVGMYSRNSDSLLGCWGGGCTYDTVSHAPVFFEWHIERGQILGAPLFVSPTASASLPTARRCTASAPDPTPTNLYGQTCGDGVCRGLETCADCPRDCGYCPGQACPARAQCASHGGVPHVCAANDAGATEGTCRPACTIGGSSCASLCCGSYNDGDPNACFPATACNTAPADRCQAALQPCTTAGECCTNGAIASMCVRIGSATQGFCRSMCLSDRDCGAGGTCSLRLESGTFACQYGAERR
jgi:hypothetical protein